MREDVLVKPRRILLLLLLAPAAILATIGFLVPLASLLTISFVRIDPSGAMSGNWIVGNYQAFLVDSFNIKIIAQTIRLSIVVTLATLLLSYPTALVDQAKAHDSPGRDLSAC